MRIPENNKNPNEMNSQEWLEWSNALNEEYFKLARRRSITLIVILFIIFLYTIFRIV